MLPNALRQKILQRFPGKLTYCFAYGSGVKKQSGYDDTAQKDAMIDLVLCVDDATEWHKQNLKQNPRDYSWMRFLGAKVIGEYQEYAAGVYCNTLIPIDKHITIKYGVIKTQDLSDDLYHWNHLYIAGRLHKPVDTLVEPTNPELKEHLTKNFENALHAALLMLPEEFTYFKLFHEIANISYNGDIRMYFGESKNKVQNIVEPQLEAFLKLYKPHLRQMSNLVHVPDFSKVCDTRIKQDISPEANEFHLEALPTHVKRIINEMKTSIPELVHNVDRANTISTAINIINWECSYSQSLKNIPTAGLFKSLVYGSRKAMKTFKK